MEQESTIEERTGTTEQESLANEQETNEQESIGSEQTGENEAESSFTSEVQTSEAESTVSEGTGATDSEGGKREITWADDLQVENDATVGGTLRAHKECLPKGDRPMKNGSAIYSTGAAYAHTPTHIGVDDSRHAEGNVDVTLLNADGEAVGSASSIPIGMTDADKAIVAEEGKKSRAYTDDRIAALGTVYIGKGDSVNYAQRAGSAVHADRAANLDSDSSDWKKIMEMTGDKYLRKDKDDTTEHTLGVGALDINGGDLTIKSGTTTYGITKEGIAKLAGAVVDYLKSSDFSKGTGVGFDGKGFGITKDAAGKYTLEIDNLVARMKMIVAELEVHEMTFIGGTVVMSACGNRMAIVEALDGSGNVIATANSDKPTLTIPDGKVADKFRCYFLASDDNWQIKNEWTVGQLARCKTNNIAKPGDYSNYQNREYWRLVVAVSDAPVTIEGKSYHYIELSNSTSKEIYLTDKAGTTRLVKLGGVCESMASLPYAGDNVIGLGHCWDTDRQNVAILSMLEGGWVIYKGISAYDLPKENIVNKFGIDEAIITTDHLILRPYAAPKETQTVAVVRGPYSDTATYGHNDLVTYEGQTWIASGVVIGETIKGEKPSATSPYWSLAAAKGIQGDKGDGYSISFLLNNVPVDVINFDTVKGMEGNEVTLEADFYNNAVSANVNKAVITCYDADGNVLGSPIEATNAENIVMDGGNLYLSKLCAYITTIAYDADGKMLVSKSIGVVRNGESVGVKSVTYKVLNNRAAGESLNWDSATEQTAYPTQKPDKGKYMYVMTIVAYSDGTTTNTVSTSYTPKDGNDGTSVKVTSTKVEYAGSDSGTTAPTSGWQTSVPSLAQGKYLWTRTTVSYSDNNSTTSYSVGRIGMDGAKGGTTHILYASSSKPQSEADVRTTIDATHQYYGTYQDTELNDDVKQYGKVTSWVLIKGDPGIQGPQGNSFDAKFLLNGISIEVLNFDTIKSLEGSEVSLEVDFLNNGMAYNVNRATLTCYDAESNVLGSPIDVTDASSIIADGGNLYLSKNCKLITAVAYDVAGNVLKEKSVTVMRDTQMYALKQLNTTRATVKASDSTTSATFALDAELHFQVVKNTGGNTENPTITSIKATAGSETFSNSAVNNIEATLTCKGTVAYNAAKRPPSTIQVEVVCEGKTLYATVPVTMEAGVAIDINNNIGNMSVTVKGQGEDISTLQSDGKSISAKVSGMDSGLKATGVDIENHKITATTDNFEVCNNSGTPTFSIDKDGNIVGAGDAYFKGTITGSVISGSTIQSSYGAYTTTIQGGSITTNSIVASGGSIGAWTIKDGGLTAAYGSKACIDLRDSKSSFRLDSNNTTNEGSLLSIYNYSGNVLSIVCEDGDEPALYIRSNGVKRNLAISTFGNNSFLSRVREGTVINRLAYACVRTGDVNVDFEDLFVTEDTGEYKYPGNVVITSNYNYEQTVKFPANPVLGVQLIVIQGTNKKVHFDGNGHSFQQGTDVSSSANSNQNGQWNLFIFDGQYWQCVYIAGHLMW